MKCNRADIFGKPGTGVHAYRVLGIAIVDVLATVIIGVIIARLTKFSLLYVLIFLFILGIIFHRIYCVRTTVDKLLFN